MKLPRPSLPLRNRGRRESDAALAFLSHLAGEFSIVLSLHHLLVHVIHTCHVELGFDSCSLALVDEDDRDPVTLLEPADHAGALDGILSAVRQEEPVHAFDAVHVGKGGLRRRVTLTAHPMRNAAGKVRWVLLDVVTR